MKKIMLVDDDTDLLTLLKHILTGKGYNVVALEEGSGVILLLESEKPDLLILDINIGAYDGRQICREIKDNPSYDHMPVVLMSAMVKEQDAIEGCLADAYIEKPVATFLFLQTIATLLAKESFA